MSDSVDENIKKIKKLDGLAEGDLYVIKFLKKVVEKFKSENKDPKVRICGGWVRDFLLGITSTDIDITYDGVSSEEFINAVQSFPEFKKVYVIKKRTSDVYRIKLKNEMLVDACVLRTFYNKVQDKPTEIDDAKCRDLTINALFLNVDTLEIEDYVGGLNDLKKRILRTPSIAKLTFEDDPLRIIRIFRFRSKYNFEVDPGIVNEAQNFTDIIIKNVPRERIVPEIVKMMNDIYVVEALRLVNQLKYFKVLFDYTGFFKIDEENICENLIKTVTALNKDKITGNERDMCIYVTVLLPGYNYDGGDKYLSDYKQNLVKILRLSNKLTSMILNQLNGYYYLRNNVKDFRNCRVYVGKLITKIKGDWEFFKYYMFSDDDKSYFEKLKKYISDENLSIYADYKPLVGVEVLKDKLKIKDNQIKSELDKLMCWEIEHPNGKNIEEYFKFRRENVPA